MQNKILGITATDPPAPVKGSGGNGQVGDKSQAGTAAASAPSADQLTLTGSARTMQKLADAVAAAPAVDAAKVAAVKQALQSGSYRVDAGRVAAKMLQYERGLK